MTELVIQCPEQPEQVLTLSTKPSTIGRGEDCDAFIVEKKASRKHLSIRLDREGRIVAEDHDSSNGTWFVGDPEQRILRRVLEDGDVLRIGDTTITVRAAAAAEEKPLVSGSLLGGSLQLTPTGSEPPPPPPAPEAEPEPEPARTPSVDTVRESAPRPAPVDRTALTRGLVVLGIAVLAFLGVEAWLGGKAEKASGRKDAHLEALKVLEQVANGSTALKEARDAYAREHPNSLELSTIERYLEKVLEREAYEQRKRDEVNILLGQLTQIPRSEASFRLHQLKRELPGNEEFERKINRALAQLKDERRQKDHEAFIVLEGRVRGMLGSGKAAHAHRLLKAFDRTRPEMDAGLKDRWRGLDTETVAKLKSIETDLFKRVDAEKNPAKQREMLAAAWPSLAGTKVGNRIGERLRSAASLAAPREGGPAAGPTPGAPGSVPGAPAPRVPTVADELLARASAAEEKLAARDWAGGRAALAKLVEETEGGRLQDEWKQRLGEIDTIVSLVTVLGEATAEEKKPRRKLSTGTWTVAAADAAGVTLASKSKGTKKHAWADVPEKDVLVLLTPKRPSHEQREAVAVLAANMGERDAFVDVLLPIYEKGNVAPATHALVARHLYGLPAAPEGGYSAYKGEILDASGVQRRKTQERIAWLNGEAGRLLDVVQEDPGFKKLAKLKAMRDELDKRRRYALTAIFNTVHYPYPYPRDARYAAVQGEIDKRTKHAREIWDNPFSVTLKRDGKLGKHLLAWDKVIEELQIKKVDTTDIEKAMAPYAQYVTGEPLTIRTYFRDQAEKELLAYNHWVMTTYNPARIEEASAAERRQVQVTNEYRMLIGYTAVVTPGSAPYASLTKENAVTVLDQAVLQKTMPLRAVRIDNRLVLAARFHSEDMSKRGYFAHQAPPNPATGEGATGPANRMQKHNYMGFGYSENIAMSASPDKAHQMWIHSSGHHRNILTGWTDLGSGVNGRNFTQNFGNGGGGPAQIQPDTTIRDRTNRGRGGTRPRTGR